MIVWSGRGFLSFIIFVVSYVLLLKFIPKEQGDYALIIGLFITGIFSWIMGKKWNKPEGRTVIDKTTGQEIILKSNHSLFWIKMEYWGIIFSAIGLILLIKQFI